MCRYRSGAWHTRLGTTPTWLDAECWNAVVVCSTFRNAELLCRCADTGVGAWHTRLGTTPTWPASVSSGWPTWWRAAVTPPLFHSHSRTSWMRLLNIRYRYHRPVPFRQCCRSGSVSFWASRFLPSSSKKSKKNFDFCCFLTSPYDILSLKIDVDVPLKSKKPKM